ncbi:hypothetical protein HK100_001335 [Physocladia obscura]|uniref:HotDog ACOT-type domain-containing protein n=1 Tax=Physocladia obscura TaxID=109957 RepID=A0AAD5T905_9FUNG|nr:hypothetical protein HK100_001335 [Physocladia obscura]
MAVLITHALTRTVGFAKSYAPIAFRGFATKLNYVPIKETTGQIQTTARRPEFRKHSQQTSNLWIHRMKDRILQLTKQNNLTPGLAESPASIDGRLNDRTMNDSFVQVFLPFRSDPTLIEDYLNPWGRIRVGKVLEDLDALAASISFLHCSEISSNLTIVTATVDRIDIIQEIPKDDDISIFGHVTYVGNSSMEITIHMQKIPKNSGITAEEMNDEASPYRRTMVPKMNERTENDLILVAKFIMVALDSETGKSAKVPQIRFQNETEREIFANGAIHKAAKQNETHAALINRPPSVEEMSFVHALYKEYIKYVPIGEGGEGVPKPENIIWMRDTLLQNINLTYPQDRNIHNKIFGGYLMRLAYEVASTTGMIFCKSPLKFLSLDDVTFRRPVEIGDILDLRSQVVYTHESKVVIKVVAHIADAQKGTSVLSNEFWFTFDAVSPIPGKTRRIIPRTYNDCMLYLEGKRRFSSLENFP